MDRSALLEQAYELAFFLHNDEEIALRIVVEAGAKLEVATIAQRKRLYYKPILAASSRIAGPGFRHRILLSDVHLFQRLIYIESEPHEKRKEQEAIPPGETELTIYFIKHLIRIALKRNSFYVNVGISRLLYNYPTSEAMEIYNTVVQDPERVKDDYYYRSRKAVLMSELKDRFGELLRTCRGPHGEERFQESDRSSAHSELVETCLSFFTPWGTSCMVPAGFDPIASEIPAFVSGSSADNDSAEVNRVHALLHPRCYARLVKALSLHRPDEKLCLPHFFLNGENDDTVPPAGRRPAPSWDNEKLRAIETELAGHAARRKKCSPQLVRVIVDGAEIASLNLKQEQMFELDLSSNAELIELETDDAQGKLTLLTHLIKHNESSEPIEPHNYRLRLQGNQELAISLSNLSGDEDRITLTVSYRKNAGSFLPLRLLHWLGPSQLGVRSKSDWRVATGLLSVLALVLLGLIVLGVRSFLFQGKHEEGPLTAKNETQIVPVNRATPENGNLGNGRIPAKPTPTPQGSKPAQTLATPPSSERTRATTPGGSGATLSEVKKIFIEPLGDQSTAQVVVRILQERFRTTERFRVAETIDQADAALKLTSREKSLSGASASVKSISVTAQLVNANGDVLWPQSRNRRSILYSGAADRIATAILRDLLAVAQHTERKRS